MARKIKVGELRDTIKLMDVPLIKTIDFNGLEIEIKQYLPLQQKINLVGTIVESTINRDNGLHIIDNNALELAFRVLLVKEYTNLTLPKDYMEAYDMLVSSGLYYKIYENIPEYERRDLRMALNNHIESMRDEYEQKNTIQYIIKDGLNKLIEKIPDEEGMKEFIKNASNELNNMNPENLKFVQEFLRFNKGE